MAQKMQRKDLRAGKTFYVVNGEDKIESYFVCKRKGERFLLRRVDGSYADALTTGLVIAGADKFFTRGGIKRLAMLTGTTL